MTVAGQMALVAGACAGAGIGSFVPDIERALRRPGVGTLRNAKMIVGRLDRLVPASVVVAVVLWVSGAPPVVATLVGAGPATVRAASRAKRRRRRRAVAEDAPLVARAVADGLAVGHGVRQAVVEAAQTTVVRGPAADELRAAAGRLQAGDPLATALAAWRTGADEPAHATLVAGLLLHGDATGELSEVLRDQARALEHARRASAEAESAIVQSRTAARIVGGLPVVSMIAAVVLAPDTVRQVTGSALGSVLVLTAVALQVVALVAVRRLTGATR